ncbi:hypothetical protein L218DRAFT_386164 [Marasmius fiardii PR-910]|nr:hypothetical protein L218DRAFT_386164 [Marasmius fiardii PR-910]
MQLDPPGATQNSISVSQTTTLPSMNNAIPAAATPSTSGPAIPTNPRDYTQSLGVNLPPGSWKANPTLGLVIHFHEDTSPCLQPVEHACLALGLRSSEFLDARADLVDEYQSELRKQKKEVKKRNEELENENERLLKELDNARRTIEELHQRISGFKSAASTPSHPSSTSGPKRKTPDVAPSDTNPAPHPKRQNTAKGTLDVQMVVPNIGFNVIDATARINHHYDTILVEYSQSRAGYPLYQLSALTFDLNTGGPEVPRHVYRHYRNHTFPTPRTLTGTPRGAQTFPSTSEELNQLVIQSQAPEAFDTMYRLAFLCWTATLLHYLHLKAPQVVPALSGVSLSCLSLAFDTNWSSYPVYIDYNNFYRDDLDSPALWASNTSNIPSIHNAPKPDAPRIEWAEAIFIHFDPKRHLGVRMSIRNNDGFIYMPTIEAFILYYTLSPLVPSSDKSSVPGYRTNLVTLLAIPGLYREIVTKDAIDIRPSLAFTLHSGSREEHSLTCCLPR